MTVSKSRWNNQLRTYELVRSIEVDADKVESKVSTLDRESHPTYLYEAGIMIGNRFIPKYIWTSENGSLFD